MSSLALFRGKEKKQLSKPKNDVSDDPKYKQYANKSLEELLEDLQVYGKHNLSWMGNGWYCALEFYVSVIGAELKVRSEFDNTTHKNAVIQCTIRLHETIEQINQTRNAS